MLCWLVILGVYMSWLQSRDKPRDIPETVSDAYLETPDISGDIPEYLSNAYEPCPSAVAEAERIVSKP